MTQSINISYDEAGSLKTELFFEFQVMFDDEPAEPERDRSWSVVPRTPTHLELTRRDANDGYCWVKSFRDEVTDRVDEHACISSPTHVTHTYYKNVSLDVYGGPRLSEFIPDPHGFCVMSDVFAERVRTLRLQGLDVRLAVIRDSEGTLKHPKLLILQFVGKCRDRTPKVEHAPNACPYCGAAPMICQECGFAPWQCPTCGKEGRIAAHLHRGEDDKRLRIGIPKGYFQRGQILEGKHWDGADLVSLRPGSLFMSKRFLDWLLMVHAAPFYVKPARFCIDGMSEKQLARLEEVQKPLE